MGWILGVDWVPYQRSTFVTPAFAGYVSGHSVFSRTGAEVLAGFTGSPFVPGGVVTHEVPVGALLHEESPSETFELNWATYFAAADEAFFFTANDGRSLWRSDGTEVGTTLLLDVDPNDEGTGGIGRLSVIGSLIYFAADDSSSNVGFEPWISDGTAAGTRLLADLLAAASSDPSGFAELPDGRVVFAAEGVSGRGLWTSDGTAENTVAVESDLDNPLFLTRVGDTVYVQDAGADRALWRTDGTSGNTLRLAGVEAADNLIPFHGRVFFSGRTTEFGVRLWATDGTVEGTEQVEDVANKPSAAENVFHLDRIGDALYFKARGVVDGESTGDELWTSDGTDAGTRLVRDINPGPEDAFSR